MTIDDALRVMSTIDRQLDGTEERAAVCEQLYRRLLESPEDFWEYFFSALSGGQPNHYREMAEKLLREGKTTHVDALEALRRYAGAQK